jgi:hypothetical protein
MHVLIAQPNGRPAGVDLPVLVYRDPGRPSEVAVALTNQDIATGGIKLGYHRGSYPVEINLPGLNRDLELRLIVSPPPKTSHNKGDGGKKGHGGKKGPVGSTGRWRLR